ncbi:MAG: LEA type 2 family protein [Thermoanaerobaculia bacterium]
MKRSLTYGGVLTILCVAAAAALLLSGCSAIQSLADIQNPRYSIRDVRPRIDITLPLSASSIDLEFALEVDNPNPVALRLDRLDFNLFINDSRILDGISDQRIQIPARGIGDVRLRTRIGYDSLRGLFNEIADVIRGNRARYEIRGNAYYDTPVGQVKLPLTVYSNSR